MQRLFNFVYRFFDNNNFRSNTIVITTLIIACLHWLTCSGSPSTSGFEYLYQTRDLWSGMVVCEWCSNPNGVVFTTRCWITGWFATWYSLLAVLTYWLFARRDEAINAWDATIEHLIADRGGRQDLPDHTTPGSQGRAPITAPVHSQGLTLREYLSFEFVFSFLGELLNGLFFHRER